MNEHNTTHTHTHGPSLATHTRGLGHGRVCVSLTDGRTSHKQVVRLPAVHRPLFTTHALRGRRGKQEHQDRIVCLPHQHTHSGEGHDDYDISLGHLQRPFSREVDESIHSQFVRSFSWPPSSTRPGGVFKYSCPLSTDPLVFPSHPPPRPRTHNIQQPFVLAAPAFA